MGDTIQPKAYRQHGGLAGEGILEECTFLGDCRKFVQRNELKAPAVLQN